MRQLREAEHHLQRIRRQRAELAEQRAQLEHQLMLIGEQYRMGLITLQGYDQQVQQLLDGRRKEDVLAAFHRQDEMHAREQQLWEHEQRKLVAAFPQQRTIVGMQLAFALLAAVILLGSILVLDHPQGMVIYQPQQHTLNTPTDAQWQSTTSPESRAAPQAPSESNP